jgi:hypothetical protein
MLRTYRNRAMVDEVFALYSEREFVPTVTAHDLRAPMTEWPLFKSDVIDACPGYEEVFLDDLFNSDQYLYPPKVPTSSSYMSMMGAEWEKARLGEKSPQEALDFVQAEAQKELDIWREQSGT